MIHLVWKHFFHLFPEFSLMQTSAQGCLLQRRGPSLAEPAGVHGPQRSGQRLPPPPTPVPVSASSAAWQLWSFCEIKVLRKELKIPQGKPGEMVMALWPPRWLGFLLAEADGKRSETPIVSGAGGNAGASISEKKLFQKRGELLWYFLSGLSLVLFVSQQGREAPAEAQAAPGRTETLVEREDCSLRATQKTEHLTFVLGSATLKD